MTKEERAATIAHNLHHIQLMRDRAAVANVTGAECPVCGGGVHPTILAAWGHCIECHTAAGYGK